MKSFLTRKSSCVNARGIPSSAHQVLHLFPEVGYPLSRGTPWPGLIGEVPEVGYPPAGYPWEGTPWPGLMGCTEGGVPPSRGTSPARSDGGVPEVGYLQQGTPWLHLAWVPPSCIWPEYPSLWTDRWMDGGMDRHV